MNKLYLACLLLGTLLVLLQGLATAQTTECDLNGSLLENELMALNSSVLPVCTSLACSHACSGAMMNWLRSSNCIKERQFNATMANCGAFEKECALFLVLLSGCDDVCYDFERNDNSKCDLGFYCANYECLPWAGIRGSTVAFIVLAAGAFVVGLATLAHWYFADYRNRNKIVHRL